jgi:UPF0716 protein FxsA
MSLQMSLGKLILLGCLALPLLEIAAFWLVATKIGFFSAFFLLLAGSMAGLALLSWLGRRFLTRVMASLREQDQADFAARPGSIMTAIGALLIAIPGFITDAIGIALLLPPVQSWLASAFLVHAERDDGVIELKDGEWRRMPDRRIGQEIDQEPDRPHSP